MASMKMFAVTILVTWITCCLAAPGSDGKYDPNKYNSGRYIPSDQGKYVHKPVPYVHVHDNRELGVYRHIHIPYDGGYGPYNGSNIPYLHDDRPYRHEEHTVSTLDINPDSYDIPVPEVSLEYGFPDHVPAPVLQQVPEQISELVPEQVVEHVPQQIVEHVPQQVVEHVPEQVVEQVPEQVAEQIVENVPEQVLEQVPEEAPELVPEQIVKRKKRSIATNVQQQSLLAILPIHYYITTAHDDPANSDAYGLDASQILIDSQTPSTTTTTSTTTPRPRVRYDDEGKWRIIRQEEEKKRHKYDYLYLTENGIYAEEQANTRDEMDRATGTSSKGFYEYTGDDGKLYRVHYTVGEQGFVPEADHIPTTPPVPLPIQRALEYIAAQKRGSALRIQQ